MAISDDELRAGDLIAYAENGDATATHIAFWLGNGRILHATQREGVDGVVEEEEPAHLRAMRRSAIRI